MSKTARLLLIALASVFISGCGVTLSPVKRKPLEVLPMETSLAPSPQPLVVQFENTLPGVPLAITVWDNGIGAFADVGESRQIGFTQNYTMLYVGAALGGVGGAVVMGTTPDYTQIVIPFGRLFQGVFSSGLQKAFPKSLVCSNDASVMEILSSTASGHLIRLKVTEFQVWEGPLNHINLRALVECKVYQPGQPDQPEYVCEIRREATRKSIGSVLTTSSGFIQEMNNICNTFTAALSADILEKLHKKLGE